MNPFNVIYPDLEGKTVLVTGAGKGIGKSIAEGFMFNQCKVIALYRNTVPLFNESILRNSIEPLCLHANIQNIEKIKSWLKDYELSGKSVDILVNNAAIYENQKLAETSEEAWDNIMNINLKATFFLSQLIANHMRKKHGGIIINAASFAATLASLNFGVYAASKAALISLTKTMAAEFAPHGIRVNAFSPGVIKTDMTKVTIGKNPSLRLKSISLNRFGNVADVSKAVMFLASEQSSYITGSCLDISGGKFIVQNPSSAWVE